MFEYNYGKHVEFDVRAGNFFRFYVKSVPFLVFFSANRQESWWLVIA